MPEVRKFNVRGWNVHDGIRNVCRYVRDVAVSDNRSDRYARAVDTRCIGLRSNGKDSHSHLDNTDSRHIHRCSHSQDKRHKDGRHNSHPLSTRSQQSAGNCRAKVEVKAVAVV